MKSVAVLMSASSAASFSTAGCRKTKILTSPKSETRSKKNRRVNRRVDLFRGQNTPVFNTFGHGNWEVSDPKVTSTGPDHLIAAQKCV
jgi:hypothetical protein